VTCVAYEKHDAIAERKERRLAREEKKLLKAKDLMTPIPEEKKEEEEDGLE
jgi:hypothetical protein